VSSTSLAEQIRAAMNTARKNRDHPRTLLTSTLLSDIANRQLELDHVLGDAEVVEVVRRAIRKRREAVEQYLLAGRAEHADREAFEAAELEQWLPPAVPEAEIRAAVRAAIAGGAGDLGAVMGRVMPQYKGRADGKVVHQIAREELAPKS
jgi:uncharacterized protein YqeY